MIISQVSYRTNGPLVLHLKQVCGYICRNKWRLMCLVVSTHYTVAMLLFMIVIVKDRKSARTNSRNEMVLTFDKNRNR